jgi:hypothetical protein
MSLLSVGSLALTLALLLGTYLITHGCVRAGCLFLACLQIPAGAYDVATGQYGFVLMSLVGGALYLRGWRRKEARELEKPRLLRRPAHQPQALADGWLAGDAAAGAAPWA